MSYDSLAFSVFVLKLSQSKTQDSSKLRQIFPKTQPKNRENSDFRNSKKIKVPEIYWDEENYIFNPQKTLQIVKKKLIIFPQSWEFLPMFLKKLKNFLQNTKFSSKLRIFLSKLRFFLPKLSFSESQSSTVCGKRPKKQGCDSQNAHNHKLYGPALFRQTC